LNFEEEVTEDAVISGRFSATFSELCDQDSFILRLLKGGHIEVKDFAEINLPALSANAIRVVPLTLSLSI
jgi:hypothetical protein